MESFIKMKRHRVSMNEKPLMKDSLSAGWEEMVLFCPESPDLTPTNFFLLVLR